MKNKIIAMLLIAILLCGVIGCAAPSANGTEDPISKATDNSVAGTDEKTNTQGGGLLGASSPVTATTVSGEMYLHIVGQKQGEIHGECSEGGDKKDTVELVDFAEGVTVPIDDESGLISGKRKYEAVTFVHKIDRTSPCLRKALSTGEQLDLTVDFYRVKNDGSKEKYYSIIYENAIIVSAEIFTKERNTHFEEVSFTFSDVTYVFNDGNISFSETWK